MLCKPSLILAQASAQFPREYAYKVFFSLQQSGPHTQYFDDAFLDPDDAKRFESSVRTRVNNMIACIGTENCIALAPLFLRSQEDALIHLTDQLVLVMHREGPVIPVLLLRQSSPQTSDYTATAQQESCATKLDHEYPNAETSPAILVPEEHQQSLPEPLHIVVQDVKNTNKVDCTLSSTTMTDCSLNPSPLTKEQEMRFVEMMTKTPISAICNLKNEPSDTISREEQLQRCKQMKQSIEALYNQRAQHEQVLANPHITATATRVLQQSLARKNAYIRQQLAQIATHRKKLIEQHEVNEVTRRVLMSGSDLDPQGCAEITCETAHLQECISLLESANPNTSA